MKKSVLKKLSELTREEYEKLSNSGTLWIVFPGAPASYDELHPPCPVPIENPDFSGVIKLAKDIIEGEESEDDPEYMYEAVMKAIYGPDVFKYTQSKK